jgi:hypothetical protein
MRLQTRQKVVDVPRVMPDYACMVNPKLLSEEVFIEAGVDSFKYRKLLKKTWHVEN